MKKSILCIIAVLVSASLCHAGGLRFGAHGAYTVGGDIGESSVGYGAQIGVDVNKNFSLELSGTMFTDKAKDEITADSLVDIAASEGTVVTPAQITAEAAAQGINLPISIEFGDVDVQNICLTAKIGGELVKNLKVYIGGGVSYNMFDVTYSIADVINSSGFGAAVQAQTGMTPAQLEDAVNASLAQSGESVDVKIESTVGFLALAGVELKLGENVALFAEYAYNIVKPKASVDANLGAQGSESVDLGEGDYSFGIAKAGLNFIL